MEDIKREKALYVRLDKEIHGEIKAIAAFKYMSMEMWVKQALIEKLMKDKSYLINNEIPK